MAYIAVCLFADEPFERVEDYTKYMNDKFTQPELTSCKCDFTKGETQYEDNTV